ncbi:hypothetical protein PR202_ga19205 [Eleusine coracana subsp. coracana]|uniref:AT-hook motif nuclear-localized protein n=1 Tax=Eleusine coracana subsp. coracana TaxID=191504 RepID=A0AAV5CVG5_ELECO|nr:hypothetical protein PR202_ga19205 [Eleusine coracana subsp. coracana]
MDGRDQQQQQPPPPPPQQQQQQPQAAPRVASPPQGGGVMNAAARGVRRRYARDAAAGRELCTNAMHGIARVQPWRRRGLVAHEARRHLPRGGHVPPRRRRLAAARCRRRSSGAREEKRGRPRKYGPDGTVGLGLKQAASADSGGGGGSNSNPDGKRRGRPPGSGKKKQLDALGSSGTSFTPHIITVKPNEDVASKIMAFSQQGPRTTCIISANGALCTATLRQPATSGGIVTYEGHFDILSLSGSFLLAEDGDTRSRTGGLSVALAGSDGRIVGGCVAGMLLMAATPVQVVVGSFIAEGKKPKEEQPKREPVPVPPHIAGFGAVTTASPPSDGTSSEHSDDPGSPLGPNGSTFTNTGHPMHSQYAPVAWSLSGNQGRYDPDLKMMSD